MYMYFTCTSYNNLFKVEIYAFCMIKAVILYHVSVLNYCLVKVIVL